MPDEVKLCTCADADCNKLHGVPVAPPQKPRNQCEACLLGFPMRAGTRSHYNPWSPRDSIPCTAPAPAPQPEDVEKARIARERDWPNGFLSETQVDEFAARHAAEQSRELRATLITALHDYEAAMNRTESAERRMRELELCLLRYGYHRAECKLLEPQLVGAPPKSCSCEWDAISRLLGNVNAGNKAAALLTPKADKEGGE